MFFLIKRNYRALFPLLQPELVFERAKAPPSLCLFRYPLYTCLSVSLLAFSFPVWEGCLLGISSLLALQALTKYERLMSVKQIWIMPSGKLKIVMDRKSIQKFGLSAEDESGVLEVQQRRIVWESHSGRLLMQTKMPKNGVYPRLRVDVSEARDSSNKYLKSLRQLKRIELPQQ